MKKDQGHIIIIKKSEETKIKMPFKSFLNFKKQKDKYIILVREKKKIVLDSDNNAWVLMHTVRDPHKFVFGDRSFLLSIPPYPCIIY